MPSLSKNDSICPVEGIMQWNDRAGNFQDHMLYLYRNDVLETNNVANADQNADLVKKCQAKILELRGPDFMKVTESPNKRNKNNGAKGQKNKGNRNKKKDMATNK